MADSKCVCEVAHSSVREISAERITLAFSTNAVLWLTFDGEISRGCKFNHFGRFNVCDITKVHDIIKLEKEDKDASNEE